ncbi:MAG TPA: NfeD family protein [Pyrinomonadaceae bacterium]|nr:NfeD family protein [Pyrinomonadaceae bacterium]
MPEFLSNITPLAVFLGIGAVGFVFLVISLVLGDIFESFGIETGLDGGAEGHALLDSRVISVFVTAFGGFGAIGIQMGLSIGASSIVGLIGGIVLGGLVSLFGRFLYKQQSSSSVTTAQLVGRSAQVIVAIAPGSIGQVSCRIGEERVEKLARARDNREIKAGATVRVDEVAGYSLIVSPYESSSFSQH